MAATFGTAHILGVCEPKPLAGFPDGRLKLRMRNKDFAKVFVRTTSSTRHFLVKESKDKTYWIPGVELGRNWTRDVSQSHR